jgi:hypothetical protein
MATGIYGNLRGADVDPSDMDVFYTYTPNRETPTSTFYRLTATDIITNLNLPSSDDLEITGGDNLLEGMYNLTLPSTIFNQRGIYTIYIRPKVYSVDIVDCGVLSALPTTKGIVLRTTDLDSTLRANNALQGYKIEYINSDNTKLRNTVRYVVTSNRCIAVTENIGNTSQTSVRYRFDDAGNLLFLQLTPSSSSSVKPNATPFIGVPNQTILLSNTFFNPIAIELELVENDIDTVIDFVGGEQIKDVDNGILTYYTRDEDNNRAILKQFDLFEIKDSITEASLFEVKQERTNIDESQDFEDIISSIE